MVTSLDSRACFTRCSRLACPNCPSGSPGARLQRRAAPCNDLPARSTSSPGASSYPARASNDVPTPCNDVPARSTSSPGASSYLARGSNDVPMPCNVSGQQPAASSTGSAKVESVAQQTCQARSCQVDQPARATSLTISLSTSLHRTICSDVLASFGPCLVSSTLIYLNNTG